MSSNYLLILLFCSINGLTFGRDLKFVEFNCSKQSDVSVDIYGAFRLDNYIGIIAELSAPKHTTTFPNGQHRYRSIFRLLYNGYGEIEVKPGVQPVTLSPNVTRDFTPYFDFQQFNESFFGKLDQGQLEQEDKSPTQTKNAYLMSAFDTPNIDVFDDQIVSQIVYINDTNGVTAYQIEVNEKTRVKVTIKKISDKLVYVVNPEKLQYEDNSGELNLYHLLMYFPPDLYIDSILIIEKHEVMYQHIIPEHKEYIALVYTRMIGPQKEMLHFRQRMIGSDRTKENRIIWKFDSNYVSCDRLDIGQRTIQGVVVLHKTRPSIEMSDGTKQELESEDIYIMEITIKEHRIIKMRYNTTTQLLDIFHVSTHPNYTKDQWMPNHLFCNCRPDPYYYSSYKRLPCPSQESQYLYDELPGDEKEVPNENQNNSWFSTTDYFLLFASIIVVIIIVVVLAFGVYFVSTGPENDN